MKQPLQGTAIITIATDDLVVMAADDLGYTFCDGRVVPAAYPVQKVFSWSDRILIGSAGKMRIRGRLDCGFDVTANKFRTAKIEYEFEGWISHIIAGQGSDSAIRPDAFAGVVFSEARKTFEPVRSAAEAKLWRGDQPGDPVVKYVVAGFDEGFHKSGIYCSEIKLNAEGNGLIYLSPEQKIGKYCLIGQIDCVEKLLAKQEPWLGLFDVFCRRHSADIDEILSGAGSESVEAVTEAVSMIKVQHEFADKTVGKTVNFALVERGKRLRRGTL